MGFQNLAGTTLGQYELRELLGAGGMGAVYRGYQANLKRYVAVKVISGELAQQPGYMDRFTREAETSAALQHPNIITIHDYGMQDDVSYIVLEMLNGGTLAERMAQRAGTDQPLPSLGEIAELLKQLGSALDYAHSRGVVHRDIKPSNVMFDDHGNAHLVDFGIAKLAAAQALTESGMVIGTWGYMAPEQWRAGELTPATDQYALGIMTYALVTGQMPFEAQTPANIMHKHLNEAPPPPRSFRPDVPNALTHVIERALAKDPRERFPTCTAFAQAFDAAIRGNTGPKTAFFTTPVKRKPAVPSRAFTPSGPPSGAPLVGTGTAERPIYHHPAMWGALVVILFMAAVIAFLVLGEDGDNETPAGGDAQDVATPTATAIAPTGIVLVPSNMPANTPLPTQTATPAPTSTPSPEAIVIVSTPTVPPTAMPMATPTVAVDPREAALATRDAMLTMTATLWTATPTVTPTVTPDWDATVAVELTALFFDDQTATATLWTATRTLTQTFTFIPTHTFTYTPTATATYTPVPTNTSLPTATPTKVHDGEPLKIGLLTDLSAVLQLYGVELQNGFTLGLDYATGGTLEVAGRPVEIIVRDYANDVALAVSQARELIEVEGVEILVGAPSSAVTAGLVDVAAEYGVILFAGPAADPGLTGQYFQPTTFRACRNSFHDALDIAAWAVDNVGLNYIQLAPDYAFGYGSAATLEFGFRQYGATFVADTIFAPTDTTDFTPYLQQVIDSGADGVIITWAGASAINLFQQAAELGLGVDDDKPMIITGFNSNDIVLAWGDEAQIGNTGFIGYHYTLPDNEINDWLVEKHIETYNDVPDLFTECGFATAQALVAGVELAGGKTFREDLIPVLEGLTWDGPKGTYHLRPEDHQVLMPMYVVRLINIDDPDQKFYELVAEMPAEVTAPPCLAPASRGGGELICLGE